MRALALLLEGALAVSSALLDGLLDLINSLWQSLFDLTSGLLDQTLEIPVLSWLFQQLTSSQPRRTIGRSTREWWRGAAGTFASHGEGSGSCGCGCTRTSPPWRSTRNEPQCEWWLKLMPDRYLRPVEHNVRHCGSRALDSQPLQELHAQPREAVLRYVAWPRQVHFAVLGDDAVAHDQDTICQQERFLDVVRHQQHRAGVAATDRPQVPALSGGSAHPARRTARPAAAGAARGRVHERAKHAAPRHLTTSWARHWRDGQYPPRSAPPAHAHGSGLPGSPSTTLCQTRFQGRSRGCWKATARLSVTKTSPCEIAAVEVRQDAEQRSFATPARSQQSEKLATPNVQVQVADHLVVFETAYETSHARRESRFSARLWIQVPLNDGRHASRLRSRSRTMRSAARPRQA